MSAPITVWADSLRSEVREYLNRVAATPDVVRVAVMPDVHLAGDACVGTAVATTCTLRPEWLGSDLGCGVTALTLHSDAALVRDPRIARALLRDLARVVPTHRVRAEALPDSLASLPLSSPLLERLREHDGRAQLGTLGSGNHFLELQADEDDRLWLMVHTGSRAMGPAIQRAHVAVATRDTSRFAFLDADSDAGRAYLEDHAFALAYAAENRARIASRAAEAIAARLGGSPDPSERIDCHHDSVLREEHDGVRLWIHRKGAVPAHDGDSVLLPGSMGTASFHLVGRGVPESLCSSAHGAGRELTRSEARARISEARLVRELEGVAHDPRAVRALVEEAPSAYKDVHRVLRAQRGLARRVRTLTPLLVHKGA